MEREADRSTGFSYQTGDVRFSDSLVSHDAHGVMQRLSNGVCRRAFSSPDALAYEMTIAPALARVDPPTITMIGDLSPSWWPSPPVAEAAATVWCHPD